MPARLVVAVAALSIGAAQGPSALVLSWPFVDCDDWVSYPGSPSHSGADAFAQDWGRRGLVAVSERRDRLGELVMSCLDTVCVSMAHLERR